MSRRAKRHVRPADPPDVSADFEHDPRASRMARRVISSLLDDPDDPVADAVTLVTSELVSNVVQHTADGGHLDAWDPRPDVPLVVEVSDRDRAAPAPRTPDVDGGRGMHIVDTLADDWGVERTEHGKVIWAEFDRSKATDRRPPR